MRLYTLLLYFFRQLYMFRMIPSFIISSTFKLQLQYLALVEQYLLPTADVEESFRLLHVSSRQQIQFDQCQML